MAVERGAAHVLRWSCWRRWHQAWARFYHYRHQERKLSEAAPEGVQGASEPAVDEQQPGEPPPDEVEIVWKRLEPLLAPEKRTGRPYGHPRRLVLEAIVHLMRTNCGWGNLPSQFPPWQTVYSQYTQWRKTGIWDIIWEGLEQPKPLPRLQLLL